MGFHSADAARNGVADHPPIGVIGFSGFSAFSGFDGFRGFIGLSGFRGFIGAIIEVTLRLLQAIGLPPSHKYFHEQFDQSNS